MKFYQHDFITMACPASIQIYSPFNPESLLEECEQEAERFNQKYSIFQAASLISKINQAAGKQIIDIDDETFRILDYARVCYEISHGVFDITAGPIFNLWQQSTLPKKDEIEATLQYVGWDKVQLKKDAFYLPQAKMSIDLGGVVKEYAVDAIASILRSAGIKHGVVNLAGDLCVIGPRGDGSPWQVGISKPGDYASPVAFINVHRGCITTSGSEERFIEFDGERFSHLISPLTGIPVSGLKSVTIRADQTITAGSISSIGMLKSEQDALAWLSEIGLPYLAIDQNGKIHGTITDLLK